LLCETNSGGNGIHGESEALVIITLILDELETQSLNDHELRAALMRSAAKEEPVNICGQSFMIVDSMAAQEKNEEPQFSFILQKGRREDEACSGHFGPYGNN
jgi:hypothetical protein